MAGALVRVAVLLWGLAAPSLAAGQIHVTGTFSAVDSRTPLNQLAGSGSFECSGDNPCVGTFRGVFKDVDCTNSFALAGSIRVTGTLAPPPGNVTASFAFEEADYDYTNNADGSCTLILRGRPHVEAMTGTFDGRRGILNGSHVDPDGTTVALHVEYQTDDPPVFGMTVQASIDGTKANATAQVQFRPEDVGKTASVYVFAYAPRAQVLPRSGVAEPTSSPKADATLPCVLAQLNAAGKLQAVSADALQAYITGVLGPQGQALTILNNVPTVQIAGASFVVGYGASPASLLTRNAVTIPGAVQCKAEKPQTGWWWNPQEPGRGFSIEARGNQLFFASYLYDAAGTPLWYVAVGETRIGGAAFQSNLLAFAGGQTLTGAFKGNSAQPSPGQLSLTFQDPTHGVLAWPGGSFGIERVPIVNDGPAMAAVANQPDGGWWWNEAEPGRGFFIEWQGGQAFVASYMYAASGAPVWYASVGPAPNIRSYSGSWLQFGGGQTLTGTFRPATLANGNVGNVGIAFDTAASATMTLPDGRRIALKRFLF